MTKKPKSRVHLLIEMEDGVINDTFIYAQDNLAMAESDYLERIIDTVSNALNIDELILRRHPEFVMDMYANTDTEHQIHLYINCYVMTKDD